MIRPEIIAQLMFVSRPRVVTGAGGTYSITSSVAANGDDAEVWATAFYSGGNGSDGKGWFGQGSGGANKQWVFTRHVLPSAIPAGATIVSASIQLYGTDFYPPPAASNPIVSEIQVNDYSSSAAPTSQANLPVYYGGNMNTLTGSILTWGSYVWDPAGWNTTPNLNGMVQALVDKYNGLASGSALVFWYFGTSTSEWAAMELYEHAGSNPATLYIKYSA